MSNFFISCLKQCKKVHLSKIDFYILNINCLIFALEIRFDMCEEMFHKSALFRDLEESFLRALSCIVQPVLYNPNMILCTKGKYAMQMIYIIQGEVLVRSKYQSNKPAAILRSGCIFGEINLFFSYPYTTNVETRTCCQLLIFEKETLFELLSLYPETLQILRGRVQV